MIDLNRHLALLPLISPPYILNFGCQPYSIIYGGFFHRLSFSLLIRLAYGFYRKPKADFMCVYKICFIFIIQALLIQIMHYVHSLRFLLLQEIIHRLVIVKTFSTINKVTILIIIGCIIWVCHDHCIILCCFCSHIIITDYYLPMSTPLNLVDHDRISLEFLL